MSFYVVPGGPYMNYLGRALSLTPTPAADASFPIGYLYDSKANVPFRFSAAATDAEVIADLCLLSDPSFEAGVVGWTPSAGAFTSSTDQASTGTHSGKLTHTGAAYALRTVTVRAGEKLKIKWAVYGGGGAVAAAVQIKNRETNNYLQATGLTWAVTAEDLVSRTTASWGTGSLAFTVESAATCLRDTVTLQIILLLSASGTVYFDDIELVPAIDWMSVHGHNIPKLISPVLQYKNDGGTYEALMTLTLRRDSFYGVYTAASEYHRYWKVLLSGTTLEAVWLGEVVLGQYLSLTCAPDYPVSIDYPEAQARQASPQGSQSVSLYGGAPARRLTLSFRFRNDTEFQQVRDVIYRLGRGGAYPSVWVPTETDPDVCVLGRTQDELQTQRISYAIRTGELEVLEEPLPLMG